MIKLSTFVKLARAKAKAKGLQGMPQVSASSRVKAKKSGVWGKLSANHKPMGVMAGVSEDSGMKYDNVYEHP